MFNVCRQTRLKDTFFKEMHKRISFQRVCINFQINDAGIDDFPILDV